MNWHIVFRFTTILIKLIAVHCDSEQNRDEIIVENSENATTAFTPSRVTEKLQPLDSGSKPNIPPILESGGWKNYTKSPEITVTPATTDVEVVSSSSALKPTAATTPTSVRSEGKEQGVLQNDNPAISAFGAGDTKTPFQRVGSPSETVATFPDSKVEPSNTLVNIDLKTKYRPLSKLTRLNDSSHRDPSTNPIVHPRTTPEPFGEVNKSFQSVVNMSSHDPYYPSSKIDVANSPAFTSTHYPAPATPVTQLSQTVAGQDAQSTTSSALNEKDKIQGLNAHRQEEAAIVAKTTELAPPSHPTPSKDLTSPSTYPVKTHFTTTLKPEIHFTPTTSGTADNRSSLIHMDSEPTTHRPTVTNSSIPETHLVQSTQPSSVDLETSPSITTESTSPIPDNTTITLQPPSIKNETDTTDNNSPIRQFFEDLKKHTLLCIVSILILLLAVTIVMSFTLALVLSVKYIGIGFVRMCRGGRKYFRRRLSQSPGNESTGSLFPRCDVTVRPYAAHTSAEMY